MFCEFVAFHEYVGELIRFNVGFGPVNFQAVDTDHFGMFHLFPFGIWSDADHAIVDRLGADDPGTGPK